MFKAMILLTRREDMTHADFSAWLLGEHRPLAAGLPGVRRVVFNIVDGPGETDVDGVSELWFDTQASFETAYATDHGKAVAADSMAHVQSRVRLFVTEHPIVEPDVP